MRDSRLIGTWRSDSRKTALEIAARRDIASGAKKKLISLFGKLELRYTPSRCYSTLGETTWVNRYVVVAKDSSSVALVTSNGLGGKEIVHVHFEGPRYWIVLGSGRAREFFKRVNPRSQHVRKKGR